jgi:hypothetical protein
LCRSERGWHRQPPLGIERDDHGGNIRPVSLAGQRQAK